MTKRREVGTKEKNQKYLQYKMTRVDDNNRTKRSKLEKGSCIDA